MDFRKIVKFNALRFQLSNDELAVADALRDASESDRELLIESLTPLAKRPRKKRVAKSAHRQSLSSAIKRGRSTEPLCVICNHEKSYEDHFKPSPNYHKFDAGKFHVASVDAASSANGEAASSTANESMQPDDASVAVNAGD